MVAKAGGTSTINIQRPAGAKGGLFVTITFCDPTMAPSPDGDSFIRKVLPEGAPPPAVSLPFKGLKEGKTKYKIETTDDNNKVYKGEGEICIGSGANVDPNPVEVKPGEKKETGVYRTGFYRQIESPLRMQVMPAGSGGPAVATVTPREIVFDTDEDEKTVVIEGVGPGTASFLWVDPVFGGTASLDVIVAGALAAPIVSGISPVSLVAGAGTQQITVSGSNFQNGLTVLLGLPGGGSSMFSGGQIQNLTPVSFQMQIQTPVAGVYTLQAINPDAKRSAPLSFTAVGAAPAITGILPVLPRAGGASQTLTVSGANFQSGLTVSVGLPGGGSTTVSGAQVQLLNAGILQVQIQLSLPGSYSLQITNPDGQKSGLFSFTAIGTTPAISGILPTNPVAASGPQSITVNGANFQAGLTMTVGLPGGGGATLSGAQIQNLTASSFQAQIPLAQPGAYTLQVTIPGGLQSSVFNFTVTGPTLSPAISGILPPNPVAGGTQLITVTGANFQSGLTMAVGFPGGGGATLSGAQIQNLTASSFQAQIPLAQPGGYTLQVTNPGGLQSSLFNFTVTAPIVTPAITQIQPSNPTVGPNQVITVSGSNFLNGLTVSVGLPNGQATTVSGAQVQNVTPNSFRIMLNITLPGTWTLRVTNLDGQSSQLFSFTVS